MNCKICGAEIPDGSKFCRVCGSPAEVQQVSAAPIQQTSLRCPVCGSSIAPGAKFCNVCGNAATVSAPASYAAPVSYASASYAPVTAPTAAAKAEKPKGAAKEKLNQVLSFMKEPKNRTPIFIGLGAIALILVVVILISSFSGGPVNSISKAALKTLNGNFTAEFDVEIEGEKISGTAMVDMNLKKQTLTAVIELKVDGEKMVVGIYDEKLFAYYPSYRTGMTQKLDLDEFFETFDGKKLDMEKLAEMIEDMTGTDVEDILDLKAAEKAGKKLGKKLNSKSWLKENAGYSTEKSGGATVHVFEPDLYDLLKACVVFFEDALEDYDDVEDALDEMEEGLSDMDITLEVGVKGGKLTFVNVELMKEIEISVEFSDVGKTKIDTEEIEEYLDDIKKAGR